VIRRNLIALAVLACALLAPAAAQADYGLVPGSVRVSALNKDGSPDTRASTHPYEFLVHFDLKTVESGETEGGATRDVIVDLPPGLVGNPQAIPTCPRQDVESRVPRCSGETQIGFIRATLPGFAEIRTALYNLAPPPGAATRLGFSLFGANIFEDASVRSEEGYGLEVGTFNIPVEATSITETIWGVPPDSGHDPERECQLPPPVLGTTIGCSSALSPGAYLTLPANCGTPLETTVKVDSIDNPGVFDEQSAVSIDGAGNPAAQSGCDAVPFDPTISSQPTTKLAENPTGLDFELKLQNQGLTSAGGTVETEPKKVVVTLPEGVTVNPSLAEGIATCSQAQYKAERLGSKAGENCPEASKLGSVHVLSPLLKEPVEGSLYLAAPYENQFNSLTALYMVARAPERGIFVKQAGKIDLNESTGQITTTFEGLPPVPFSSFKLHFREGARAPLATPQACGEYTTTAKMTPFSASSDAEAVETSGSFQIEHGAEGGPCPGGGLPPFHPGLIAGSINNAAGKFSPFNVRLFRSDTEQEFTRFSIKLPPGVSGKLAGIPFCPDADIAAAKAKTGIHGGQEEIEHPSCPAASEVGHSLVGTGVGQVLAYVPGKLYLAGPYHGSAISLVAITAAKAGPFDLGTVVLRYAFRIDPETGEVFIDATGSDPIPHIIKGVTVHAKDIRAYTDRPEFVINPTNCSKTSTASTLLGSGLDFASEADDRPVTVSTPYQAADCAALPFKPRLALKLKGGTHRGSYPALRANLNMNGIGEAGIHKAEVILPRSEFIANAHFQTICTRVQFKQAGGNGEACPAGSIYGYAKAVTPLLSTPLEGPIFLRSNGNERKLPDVVAALHNGEINIHLVGFVDSVKGRLRNTFESTPDAPVSSVAISLFGGAKGLFQNSTNLCKGTHKVEANFTGQNGKESDSKPVLEPLGCKGSSRKGSSKHHKRKA
jgi:hypothetical protein